MNQPWGLSGPEFLAIFGAGLALTTFAPLLLRRLLGWVPGAPLTRHLDAYEVGYLAGGPYRVGRPFVGLAQLRPHGRNPAQMFVLSVRLHANHSLPRHLSRGRWLRR